MEGQSPKLWSFKENGDLQYEDAFCYAVVAYDASQDKFVPLSFNLKTNGKIPNDFTAFVVGPDIAKLATYAWDQVEEEDTDESLKEHLRKEKRKGVIKQVFGRNRLPAALAQGRKVVEYSAP